MVIKMSSISKDIDQRKSKLKVAQEIKNVLESQRQDWLAQRSKLTLEQDSLEERETVHVAASVYLVRK